MTHKLLTIIFLMYSFIYSYSQSNSRFSNVLKGKWALTRYTETFNHETYNRPIVGVKNYEPKSDSSYKEMNQNDSVSVYEFMADNTYTLFSKEGNRFGKWLVSEKDSVVTLYSIQTFNSAKELQPKSNSTYNLKMFSKGGLFLMLLSYDKDLGSTHKLYYKKNKAD